MPTLAYTGKQSTGSKECGAYALTACLLALRKIPTQTTSLTYILPTVETQSGDTMDSGKVIMRTANVPPSAVKEDLTDPCAQEIYKITGLLQDVKKDVYEDEDEQAKNPGTYPPVYSNDPDYKGLNPASALAWVAKQLGCTVAVWVDQNVQATLNQLYPREEPLLKGMQAPPSNISFAINGIEPNLPDGAVRLVLVDNGSHWLAQDSKLRYYDPATGAITEDLPDDYYDDEGNENITGCYITLS
jgi:hypothetical protein